MGQPLRERINPANREDSSSARPFSCAPFYFYQNSVLDAKRSTQISPQTLRLTSGGRRRRCPDSHPRALPNFQDPLSPPATSPLTTKFRVLGPSQRCPVLVSMRRECGMIDVEQLPGRMIQSLCSLRIQDSAAPLERNGSVNRGIRHVLRPEPDLSSMLENFAGSFKGLPQEIVDEILDYLVDYRRTLVACSLTCKGLFRSTRRIIHRRLYIVGPGRANTSDGQEIRRSETVNRSQLHLLSTAARCGLTWYTRELTIRIAEEFTPNNLLPHLPQFQAFTRLTSITLYHFDPTPFLPVFEQYFGHLALQMRSLEFIYPPGPQDDMMYFISQFPNLEDLRFDSFPQHNLNPSKEYNISTIRSSPTLGGTLRVTSANAWRTNSLKRLTQLPSGLRFRSIELLRCTEIDPNIMIRECASTLQSLTHVFHTCEFPSRNATGMDT